MNTQPSTIWPHWPNDWALFWLLICIVHLTVSSCYVTYAFHSEYTLQVANVKELLAQNRRVIWSLSDRNWTRTQNHLVRKRTLNHLAKLVKWLSCVLTTYLSRAFDCMLLSCDLRVSEWIHTPSCLNVQELLVQSRLKIWSLSDCNWTRTQYHLVRKRTLNNLAKLVKWLSCVLSTYLYGAFDCMFLPCHVGVSEWIYTP